MKSTEIKLHRDDFKLIIWDGLIEQLVLAKKLDKSYIDGTRPIETLTLFVSEAHEGW